MKNGDDIFITSAVFQSFCPEKKIKWIRKGSKWQRYFRRNLYRIEWWTAEKTFYNNHIDIQHIAHIRKKQLKLYALSKYFIGWGKKLRVEENSFDVSGSERALFIKHGISREGKIPSNSCSVLSTSHVSCKSRAINYGALVCLAAKAIENILKPCTIFCKKKRFHRAPSNALTVNS